MSNYPEWFQWWWVLPLAAWCLFWKGLALWHSARRGNAGWFWLLLVVNTAGILEIGRLWYIGLLRRGKLKELLGK